MKVLVTGCAGFIGSNLVDKLLSDNWEVVGVDNFNDYYDPKIKEANLQPALTNKRFKLYKVDVLDLKKMRDIFANHKFEVVVHLAARAGVRSSIVDPKLYCVVNTLGTVNVLELCKEFNVEKFIFGSSSSVYGKTKRIPFTESDKCDEIISPYGASKRAAEFFVESINRDSKVKTVIMRFFTVYGPRGRVDMAPHLFVDSILNGKEITMFGEGDSSRDYTYIDDVVEAIVKSISQKVDFEILNVGGNQPVKLLDFISHLEELIGKKAIIKKVSMQEGDLKDTWADISNAKKILSWSPKTEIRDGLENYIRWFKSQT